MTLPDYTKFAAIRPLPQGRFVSQPDSAELRPALGPAACPTGAIFVRLAQTEAHRSPGKRRFLDVFAVSDNQPGRASGPSDPRPDSLLAPDSQPGVGQPFGSAVSRSSAGWQVGSGESDFFEQIGLIQRISDGLDDHLEDAAFVLKFYFALCGMDVDINLVSRDSQKEDTQGEAGPWAAVPRSRDSRQTTRTGFSPHAHSRRSTVRSGYFGYD